MCPHTSVSQTERLMSPSTYVSLYQHVPDRLMCPSTYVALYLCVPNRKTKCVPVPMCLRTNASLTEILMCPCIYVSLYYVSLTGRQMCPFTDATVSLYLCVLVPMCMCLHMG